MSIGYSYDSREEAAAAAIADEWGYDYDEMVSIIRNLESAKNLYHFNDMVDEYMAEGNLKSFSQSWFKSVQYWN
jgi:N-acetylglucosamine kinase-like BadF-type ATPase